MVLEPLELLLVLELRLAMVLGLLCYPELLVLHQHLLEMVLEHPEPLPVLEPRLVTDPLLLYYLELL
jgi:hypothetical protein